VCIGTTSDCESGVLSVIEKSLRALIPWRKGPFTLHGININTEWRSDWKWQRIAPHVNSLKGKRILDVGSGNGYYCLRSYGQGAARVIGIDPSPRFVVQYYMIKHFLGDIPVDVLPIGIEALPANLTSFDTTFSMGVLYHRRSPMDHLRELKATLKPGGQLILETLLIDGKLGEVLVPEGRYAMMNNVWFLPSADTLISWLKKCGFNNPRLVDINQTHLEEQRQTEWMRFHSLAAFLDPSDHNKTIEGHPAPLRGVFLAEV
jgi:tRNA (mo5U34)-methyltransferase